MLGYPITFLSRLVKLNDYDKKCIMGNKEISEGLYKELDEEIRLIKKLTSKSRVFVRLFSLSPKNSDKIGDIAVIDVDELLKLLHNSPRAIGSLSKSYNNGIMLREFHQDLPTSFEFRLFVHGSHLRAISQYNCYEYIPELDDENIKDRIINIIKNKIEYIDSIIDIVIWDGKDGSFMNLGIWIIEINTFGAGLLAGSCLYNWIDDYDTLHYSKKPDYRINKLF